MKLYNSPYAFASYYNQMIYTARVAPLQGCRIDEAKTEGVSPIGSKNKVKTFFAKALFYSLFASSAISVISELSSRRYFRESSSRRRYSPAQRTAL